MWTGVLASVCLSIREAANALRGTAPRYGESRWISPILYVLSYQVITCYVTELAALSEANSISFRIHHVVGYEVYLRIFRCSKS